MDRLMCLRKSDGNSMLSNTSVSSELGYETAQDDSFSTTYYSINDETLTDFAASPNSSDHAEPTIVSEPLSDPLFCHSSPNEGSSIVSVIGTDSSTEISSDRLISVGDSQPIVSSGTDDIAEKSIVAAPEITLTHQDVLNHELDVYEPDVIATAPNSISTLPSGPSVSSNNLAGGSIIVQELCVVAVSSQQPTDKASELGRTARRTTVRFQDNALPRRHELARRTVMSRASEMPRRSILPLARRTQVESNGHGKGVASKQIARRPLTGTKPEPHTCDICKKSFPLQSTLNVHKNTHKIECKYCDRKFNKPVALSNHLKENCQKIPSVIRRNILAKEFKNGTSRM